MPCLYDFDRQSDSSAGRPSFDNHAVYMGLGWIQPNKVLSAPPGTTSHAVLSPLSGSGDLLVIKIPLSDGGYYLVENRQQIGFDRMLPDSGILILKVDPNAPEGHGTVKIMNADPSTGKFVKAVYRLEESNRNIFKERIIAEALRAFRESNFEKSVSIAGQGVLRLRRFNFGFHS